MYIPDIMEAHDEDLYQSDEISTGKTGKPGDETNLPQPTNLNN
jgi:hypothetical protein